MAIKFGGEFEVKRSRKKSMTFSPIPEVCAAAAGFSEHHAAGPDSFYGESEHRISYIKGAANIKMELAEADRPRARAI